jgi:hypothetical protein
MSACEPPVRWALTSKAFTKVLVVVAVNVTAAGSPERDAKFELIARHFIRADMTVTLRADDSKHPGGVSQPTTDPLGRTTLRHKLAPCACF